MRRREVVAGLSAAAVWPQTARAQAAGKVPTIGFVSPNSQSAARLWSEAFVRRLGELGWIESRTVEILYRWGEGRTDVAASLVADLIRLKVSIIITHGVAYIEAAKQSTATIPIVFALATDPVGSGFVASLARPGGNLTGLSIQSPDLGGKRIELLREVLPDLRRVAILGDLGSVLETREVQTAASALRLEALTLEVARAEEITPALERIRGRVDALYVCAVPLMNTNREQINNWALAARLPTLYGFREAVTAGGLMSYGPNFADLFRRAGDYVDKILRGAKPADLPIEQPAAFDLVVNLRTARALGLDVPSGLLVRADGIIE